jgi:transketolase
MKVNTKNHEDPLRDRLVFSKAHDAKALYAVLAERGFFDRKILERYEVDNSVLPGHSTRHCVPGVEVSAGSLGHGLPMACGMAFGLNLNNELGIMNNGKTKKQNHNSKFIIHNSTPRVFAILSDGECDEGSTWEAALFAGHHHLDNLVIVVDYNKLQGLGYTKDVLDLEPFTDKWKAFGFAVRSVNGHSYRELVGALSAAPFTKGRPSVIVANTVKGYGGPSQYINHVSSQYKAPSEEDYKKLIEGI